MSVILSVAVKVALLVLAALATMTALRHRSAALRHWVLASALLGSLSVPIVELSMPGWSIPLPGGWSRSVPNGSLRFASDTPALAPSESGEAAVRDDSPLAATSLATTLLASIWAAGVSVSLAIFVAGLFRLRRLAHDSEPVTSGPWRVIAAQVCREYGLQRAVRLLYCPHPTMLATWGLRNPRVLLPVGAEHWTEDRIHAVVRHELAHVVRGDWGTAVVASVLRAIYWFNPLLWIAYGRLRQEAERACDDIVLASGISGADYATHLLGVARESARQSRFWSPAIAIADRSTLEGRVRAMLNARVNRAPLTGLTKASTAISLVIVTVFVGTVTLSSHTEEPARADVYLSSSALPALIADPSKVLGDAPRPRSGTQATRSSGGTIEGVLYDQFGGLLPGASVRLTQLGSGSVQTASTDRGGAFAFRGLAAADYELLTELPGFTTVRNVIRAESSGSVRRHITLPLGTLEETIHATCGSVGRLAAPSTPTASATPGAAKPAATSGAEPKIPATFTGGIGGQIRVPRKVTHVNPICPSNATPASTVIRLAGRIGIDGLFSDLQNLSTSADPAYVASAMDAVRGWVFTPTLLNGAPIEVNISVTVSYSWSN